MSGMFFLRHTVVLLLEETPRPTIRAIIVDKMVIMRINYTPNKANVNVNVDVNLYSAKM